MSPQGVWVGGQRTFYLRNSRHEADRASRLLSDACGFPVFTRGVIVIFADEFSGKRRPEDVTVLRSNELRQWLKKRPPVPDAPTGAEIYAQARKGSVWRR